MEGKSDKGTSSWQKNSLLEGTSGGNLFDLALYVEASSEWGVKKRKPEVEKKKKDPPGTGGGGEPFGISVPSEQKIGHPGEEGK